MQLHCNFFHSRAPELTNFEDPTVKRQIRKGMIPPLHVVEEFMLSLMNTNEGKSIYLRVSFA